MNTRKTLFLGCGALAALFVGTNVANAALDPVGSFTVRRGTDGAAGAAGAPGKSAYDIWKKAGNTGTEADFLASLVGATGAPGQNGTNGTNGTDGCATTITKSKVGKVTTLTAKDCNNTVEWTETIEDGTDGNDGAPGCGDKVTFGDKDANGCVTITKTPYSLVNGTCTAGTPDSQKVCEPIVCEPVISTNKDASTKCVTYSTQKRKANAAGTACENDGAADTEVVCPLECESHEESVPCGPVASGAGELCEIPTKKGIKTTKYKCDGTTVDGIVYTYDGDDAPDQCEGLSAADKATRRTATATRYVIGTPDAQGYYTSEGYVEETSTTCDGQTHIRQIFDPCDQVIWDAASTACPTGTISLRCTNQENTSNTYRVCKATESGDTSYGDAMNANKILLQEQIDGKLSATDAAATYANKTDVYNKTQVDSAIGAATSGKADKTDLNAYLKTDDLGTALKDNTLKTDLAAAVTDSGALNGYATSGDVSSAVAGKADKTDLNAYLKTDDLGTALKDNTLKTDLAAAVTGSGALSNYASKTEVESAVSGKADADDLVALSGKVDTNTTEIGKKLNTADFGTQANTWAGTQNTLAKQADLRTVEGKADQASEEAETASRNASSALSKATTNESNISSLNTQVCGSDSGRAGLGTGESSTCSGGLVSSVSNLESVVGTSDTQGLRAQIAELNTNYTNLQRNYNTLSQNYTTLQTRVAAMESCSSCSAPKQ